MNSLGASYIKIIIFALLFIISLYDFLYYRIPNKILIPLSIIVIFEMIISKCTIQIYIHKFLVGIIFVLILVVVKCLTKGGMGLGDIKLIFVTSLYFGLVKSYIALFIACFFGLLMILICKIFSKGISFKIPFAPFLSAGYFLIEVVCRIFKC